MKITKRQLRKIVKEEKQKLLKEYEQYVDEDGNVYDDEGNVERRGSAFGRKYGGGTYGTKAPWQNSTQNQPSPKIKALETALESLPNNFLQSVLNQLKAGRKLSAKQVNVVKKILSQSNPELVSIFESKKMKIKLSELKKLIREEKTNIEEVDAGSPTIGNPPGSANPLFTCPPHAGDREAEMLEQVYDNLGKIADDIGWEHLDQELLEDNLTETMKLLKSVMVRLGVFSRHEI